MSVSVQQILGFLRAVAPQELALDWDNVGLLVDAGQPVDGVLTTLDITPAVVREAVCRALGETPALACDLTAEEKAGLAAAIDELKDEHAHGGTPTAVRLPQPDGAPKPVEFSFFVPQQYGSAAILTRYPSYSEMLEDYYATKDRAERLRQKSRELYKAVHNMYDRAVRKQAARKEELSQSAKADTLRLYGELLQANLWAIHKGDRKVTVQNYYTGEDVTIRLDPRLGGNENAQKYFRDYKKKQTAHAMLQKLLVEGEAEIEYLRTVLYGAERDPRRAEKPGLLKVLQAAGPQAEACGLPAVYLERRL